VPYIIMYIINAKSKERLVITLGNKKIGRPQSKNPPNIRLNVCVCDSTKSRLIELSDRLKISQSAVVRRSIDELYERIEPEKPGD